MKMYSKSEIRRWWQVLVSFAELPTVAPRGVLKEFFCFLVAQLQFPSIINLSRVSWPSMKQVLARHLQQSH